MYILKNVPIKQLLTCKITHRYLKHSKTNFISRANLPLDIILHVGTQLGPLLPMGFEPTIAASERPQTHAFDSAATAIG
jgi:hypothetical protein